MQNKEEKEAEQASVELKNPRAAIEEAKEILSQVWEDGYG